MTKQQILTGVLAAALATGAAAVTLDAQGRRGPAGRPGMLQGQLGGQRGQMLGAPGRGFGGRLGGRRGGGPLAGLAAAGLTDDQQTKLKTILDAAQAEREAARAKTHDAIGAILTPEQKAKLGWK